MSVKDLCQGVVQGPRERLLRAKFGRVAHGLIFPKQGLNPGFHMAVSAEAAFNITAGGIIRCKNPNVRTGHSNREVCANMLIGELSSNAAQKHIIPLTAEDDPNEQDYVSFISAPASTRDGRIIHQVRPISNLSERRTGEILAVKTVFKDTGVCSNTSHSLGRNTDIMSEHFYALKELPSYDSLYTEIGSITHGASVKGFNISRYRK